MERYSVSVALFDYLPVFFTAVAMLLLLRIIQRHQPALSTYALIAALLIPAGGFCKASWKLLIATGGVDIPWLENLLFILMAPGFVVMAWCLFHGRRNWQTSAIENNPSKAALLFWLALPLFGSTALFTIFPDSRYWFFWLLAVTTVANISLLIQAILMARWNQTDWPAVHSFAFSFIAILAMSGLSRLPDTEASAWIQESVNLSAQAALALGCWRLSRKMNTGTQSS